nr:polyprotein [Mute swan feces associated picorna-like virus 7]
MITMEATQIRVYSNVKYCIMCGTRCCGTYSMWNHVKNSHKRDHLPVRCKCGQVVTEFEAHEKVCAYHGKQQCDTCGASFKNHDKKENHYNNSSCKPASAQGFGGKTIEELKVLCRNNTHRRRIVMNLIQHTDYYAPRSVLRQLDLQCWPAFQKTVPSSQLRSFYLQDGTKVVLNLKEERAYKLWKQLEPNAKSIPKAQIGFTFDHKLVLDESVSRFFDTISMSLERMNVEETISLKVLNVVIKLIYAAKLDFTDPILVMTWMTDVMLSLGVAKTIKDLVMSRVRQMLETPRAQAESSSWLFGPLVTVFSAIFFDKIPNADMMTKLTKLGGLSRGVLSIWQLLEKIFSKAFPVLYEFFVGYPYEVEKLNECLANMSEWYADVQHYVSLDMSAEISKDPEICRQIERSYKQGMRYCVDANSLKLDPKMMSALHTHFGVMKKVFDKVENSGALAGGPRMEPIVIQLYGASGVGKTHMVTPLAIELLKLKGIKDPSKWNQEIYTRMAEQEFWDNYFGQRICIYDDFGQKSDSEQNPDIEYFELIRTGNICAYPLHMAHLLEKNKTYFSSEAVLLTTNWDKLQPKSVNFPEAVRRRIDIAVEVKIRSEFLDVNGKMDKAKVGNRLRLDIYKFFFMDPNTGKHLPNQKSIGYQEFVQYCHDKYQEKIDLSKNILEDYEAIARAPPVAQNMFHNYDENMRHRITRMTEEEVRELVLGMYSYEDFLSSQCRQGMMDFDPTDGDSNIWENWRSWLYDNIGFAPDFVEHVKEIEREKMAECGADQEIWNAFGAQRFFFGLGRTKEVPRKPQDVRSWRDNFYLQQLQDNAKEFKERILDVVDMAKDAVKRHPFLATFLVVWPTLSIILSTLIRKFRKRSHRLAVQDLPDDTLSNLFTPLLGDPDGQKRCAECDFVYMTYHANGKAFRGYCRCSWQESQKGKPKLTHEHEGLVPGIRVTHFHNCEDCGEEFSHCHTIKPKEVSETYPQKCNECLKTFKEQVKRDSGFIRLGEEAMVEYLQKNKETMPLAEKIAWIELSASGDPRTAKMSREKRVQLHAQLSDSSDPKTAKEKKASVQDAKAEFMRDTMGFNVGMKVQNNIYNITFCKGKDQFAQLRGIFIQGRVLLTVQHALTAVAASTHILLWNNEKPDGFRIPVEELETVQVVGANGEFKDQLLIGLPKSVQVHADILKHVVTSDEISRFSSTNGVVLTPYRNGLIQRFGEIRARDTPLDYSEGDKILTLRNLYEYNLETKDGDCGSPVLVVNSQLPRKICGLHVAGNYGGGFATALNQRDIVVALEKFDKSYRPIMDFEAVANCCTRTELTLPEGNFSPIGKSEHLVVSSTKTKLRPSLVHAEVQEPTTAPAVLRPIEKDGKMHDPMLEGLKKCGSISPPLDKQKLAVAVNDVKQNFKSDPSRQRVLSNWESVTGIEGDEFAAPITRTTSAGYPFRFQTKQLGKTEWLGSDEQYFLPKEIEEIMEKRISDAKEGKRYPTVWIDTLKDERRPHAKVNAGKTRVFSAGPMDFTLVFRKYFLGFLSHVSHNRNDNEVSVGTNVYSPDWTKIALILQSKGKRVVAGDFTNFDGTLHIDILWGILDVINAWYHDGQDNIREMLWLEIVNSVHVCKNSIYMWTHSQPSGCPATAVINSIYNSIACRYVFLLLAEGTDYSTMRAFRRHVAMVAYGDDNVLNISNEISELYNQETMAKAFATFGMIYTDEAKSGQVVPYRTLEQVNYLKRSFVRQKDGHYIAPMAVDNILEIGNWIRECADHKQATADNVENLCFELSLHEKSVFDFWAKKYAKACDLRQVPAQILTFEEYRFTELVKYGRITAKTEASWEDTPEQNLSRKEGSRSLTGAIASWESCGRSKARFEESEWRAQIGSIASCVPLKIQANSPPAFEGRSNSASGVCRNDRIAMNNNNNNESIESQQITHFVDDVNRVEYVKPAIKAAEQWINSGSETMHHTIEDILARPTEIASGTFTNTSFTTQTFPFPEILITQQPNILAKINKFEFLRADIKVKIIFNATPFQQGKYWLFFSPFDSVCGRPETTTIQNNTGYPGVELDIASGAPIELTIPYCSPMSHYRLPNGESTMGTLTLREIAGINSGVLPTVASYTIMAWFENVRLSMPTPASFAANPPRAQMAWAQMAMDEQEIQTSEGTISAVSNGVAVAADAVGRALPKLSEITTPVSWVARTLSGVASTFGFNKPTSVAATHPYVNHPGRGYTNMDGLDNSHMLAACPDNKLTTDMSYFSSEMDEMSLDYVKKKSCIVYDDIEWTTADNQYDRLLSLANTPGATQLINGTEVNPTTLGFLGSIFRYWRGGIKYRLAFAKTAFHTGRLRIAFVPAGLPAPPSTKLQGDGVLAHNWILDLSQSSELEFEIPYVSNTPWTRFRFLDYRTASLTTPEYMTGTLVVEVLTELRRSSNSVSDTVVGQLWHCGADDLEFAVPEIATTIVDDTAFVNVARNEELRENRSRFQAPLDMREVLRTRFSEKPVEAVAQIFNMTGGGISHQDQEAPSAIQVFPDSTEEHCLAEQMCIGEKITNLRQVIKRFGEYQRGRSYPYRQTVGYMPIGPYNPANTANDPFFFNSLVIDPAYFGEKDQGLEPVPITADLPTAIDASGIGTTTEATEIGVKLPTSAPLHYISYLYRFWRGSKRYKMFFPGENAPNGAVFRVGTNTTDGITTSQGRHSHPLVIKRETATTRNGVIAGTVYNSLVSGELTDSSTFETTIYPDITGCAEFEVPYYSTLPISLVGEGTLGDETGPLVTRNKILAFLGQSRNALDVPAWEFETGFEYPTAKRCYRQSLGNFRLFTAAGDDFSFGYMVGAPVLRLRE